MELILVNDEIEAAMRTIRLAQAQVANLKKSAKSAARTEELEAVELVLNVVLRKLKALRLDE